MSAISSSPLFNQNSYFPTLPAPVPELQGPRFRPFTANTAPYHGPYHMSHSCRSRRREHAKRHTSRRVVATSGKKIDLHPTCCRPPCRRRQHRHNTSRRLPLWNHKEGKHNSSSPSLRRPSKQALQIAVASGRLQLQAHDKMSSSSWRRPATKTYYQATSTAQPHIFDGAYDTDCSAIATIIMSSAGFSFLFSFYPPMQQVLDHN